MKLEKLLSDRSMDKKTNIPVEAWTKPMAEQGKILAANGMPNMPTLKWTKTKTDKNN